MTLPVRCVMSVLRYRSWENCEWALQLQLNNGENYTVKYRKSINGNQVLSTLPLPWPSTPPMSQIMLELNQSLRYPYFCKMGVDMGGRVILEGWKLSNWRISINQTTMQVQSPISSKFSFLFHLTLSRCMPSMRRHK